LGSANEGTYDELGQFLDSRILDPIQALVLLYCIQIFQNSDFARQKIVLSRCITFAGYSAVILSQQRTVWVVAAIVVVLNQIWSRNLINKLTKVVPVLIASSVIYAVFFSQTFTSISYSFSDRSTLSARQSSWDSLLSAAFNSGPMVWLTGQPFGSGFARWERDDLFVTYAPHNWYLTIFLRLGLVGLVALAASVLVLLVQQVRILRIASPLNGVNPVPLVVGLLFFGFTYAWDWSLVFAVSIAVLNTRHQNSSLDLSYDKWPK
jgi:O-antigen ligase